MALIETTDTPEDVDRLLTKARDQLQAFEDAVDGKRLLARIKRASPAHPVLLARAMFLFAGILFFLLTFVVIAVVFVNTDVAKFLDELENGIGIPGGIPVVCILLSLFMLFANLMTTFAAHSIGRESPMLPWEAKEHQKLVNEVTRLTTQKAVMERIRATPGGARPRISTPVPMSMRSSGPTGGGGGFGGGRAPSSPGFGGGGGFGNRPGGESEPPSYLSGGGGGGGFGSRPGAESAPPSYLSAPSGGGFGGRPNPGSGFGGSSGNAGGGFGAGRAPSSGGFGSRPSSNNGFGEAYSAPDAFGGDAPSSTSGLLDRARGSSEMGDPGPDFGGTGGGFGSGSGFGAPSQDHPTLGQSLGSSTRGGTPLGAKPRGGGGIGKPRLAAPMSFPGTPEPSGERYDHSRAQIEPLSYSDPDDAPPRVGIQMAVKHPVAAAEPALDVGDIVESFAPGALIDEEPTQKDGPREKGLPHWGRIDEMWLEEAIEKAENMVMGFPEQARLEFSKEADLPFTLVIERATPAMAVRAMVSYVEFLASIYTPKLARIELVKVAHLDRSFHRNVDAALQPYFAGKVRVENNPGRVDIVFSDPDPGWEAYPSLPIRD